MGMPPTDSILTPAVYLDFYLPIDTSQGLTTNNRACCILPVSVTPRLPAA